jgi:hypothetical protein
LVDKSAGARLWRRVSGLSWSHRWLLVEATIVMHALALLLRFFPLQRVYSVLSATLPGRGGRAKLSAQQMEDARAAAPLVDFVSRHGLIRATCLHRSLVLWWLMRRRGVTAHLKLGARRADGAFDGHAWVELDGIVLNDREDVTDNYVPLPWLLSGPDA